MRIFLDANVIFSAFKADGPTRKLVVLLSAAQHDSITNLFVMEKAERNLRAKFRLELDHLGEIADLIDVSPIYTSENLPSEIELVDKDIPVLASAIALRCDALVTGDRRHFGHLYGFCVSGVDIHSLQSIAELLVTN